MTHILAAFIATNVTSVPDAGPSGLLMGLALLSVAMAVRFIKNRKR